MHNHRFYTGNGRLFTSFPCSFSYCFRRLQSDVISVYTIVKTLGIIDFSRSLLTYVYIIVAFLWVGLNSDLVVVKEEPKYLAFLFCFLFGRLTHALILSSAAESSVSAVFEYPIGFASALVVIHVIEIFMGNEDGVAPKLNFAIKILTWMAFLCELIRPNHFHHFTVQQNR